MSAELNRQLSDYHRTLEAAEELVPLLGRLWRTQGVPTYVWGQPLYLKSPLELLRAHEEAQSLAGEPVLVADTLRAARVANSLSLSPARLDLGKLARQARAEVEGVSEEQVEERFDELLRAALAPLTLGSTERAPAVPQDVVLYGFGRIGRLLARLLIERMGGGERFRLRAIVTRPGAPGDLAKRADLLRRDSVHGPFEGSVTLDEERQGMIINGCYVQMIASNAPEEADYERYGITNAVIIDNTGKWRDREGLSRHFKASGASKVILTAPAKGDVPNIVFGINHDEAREGEAVLSAASCTTNAIAPVLKLIDERFGIVSGHMQSVHAYTNDQNLIDNYHKKERRGRSAAMNMVITETGAAKAVAKVCPQLKGKLTANAIRVPTPNVSMAIMSLQLNERTSVEEINAHLMKASREGALQYQLDCTTSPDIVSTDLVGNRHASVVDTHATLVHEDGDKCTLYVWYDNEFGYACQVTRLLEHISRAPLSSYP